MTDMKWKLEKITPGALMTDKRAHYGRKKRIMNNLIFHFKDENTMSRKKFFQMSIAKINSRTINLNCTKRADDCIARQTLKLGENLKTEVLNPNDEGKRLQFWWSLENDYSEYFKNKNGDLFAVVSTEEIENTLESDSESDAESVTSDHDPEWDNENLSKSVILSFYE